MSTPHLISDSNESDYQETEEFLHFLSQSNVQLAQLGFRCLESIKKLGLCDPNKPWLIKEGKGLEYQSLAVLPFDAAIKAHFCLKAIISQIKPALPSVSDSITLKIEKLQVHVSWDSTLTTTLENIVKFLKGLEDTPRALTKADDRQAEKLIEELKGAFNTKSVDLPISQYALKVLKSTLKSRG
ncbi:hypothetical protein C8J55DRAFT_562660 [Lentinula edodes]|uniref:Uncharacterized protein n=1 Tax=Lentinula lateritia TaxID=40482 RepID=A0A9W9DJU5_9AGAR|nr:hypothetical protein C8J55DRAFT_562660 [Lentinula edodes]